MAASWIIPKRVNDKEQRISELKKGELTVEEKETTRLNQEKADLSRKLSELSLSYATPNLNSDSKELF